MISKRLGSGGGVISSPWSWSTSPSTLIRPLDRISIWPLAASRASCSWLTMASKAVILTSRGSVSSAGVSSAGWSSGTFAAGSGASGVSLSVANFVTPPDFSARFRSVGRSRPVGGAGQHLAGGHLLDFLGRVAEVFGQLRQRDADLLELPGGVGALGDGPRLGIGPDGFHGVHPGPAQAVPNHVGDPHDFLESASELQLLGHHLPHQGRLAGADGVRRGGLTGNSEVVRR